METGATRGPPRPGWIAYLVTGAVVVLLYGFLPHGGAAGVSRVVVYTAVTLSAAVAIVVGVWRNRPPQRLPWLLLALSQVFFAAGDALFYTATDIVGSTTFPDWADAFYLARYPLAVAGLALLVARRTPGRDLPGLLDASTVTVGAALLSWLFLVSPLTEAALSTGDKVVLLAYPILDLALLAVALRLLLGRGRRPTAFYLLMGGLLAFFGADTVYSYQTLHGQFQTGTFDAVWLVGNLAVGAAALHPGMADLGRPASTAEGSPSRMRPWLLLVAAMVAPVALFVQFARGTVAEVDVTAVACALLFALTTLRMETMLATQRRLAVTDSLTGLYTRRFVEVEIPPRIARAARNGETVALLIIDVDHFKNVNDRYGHPAGDEVLVEIARRLRSACLEDDVLARHGGEEFALLAPRASDGGLAAFAAQVRARVAATPIRLSTGRSVEATVSVGVAAYPRHGSTSAELQVRADRALYRAKDLGRDRVVVGEVPDRRGPADEVAPAQVRGVLRRFADDVDRRDHPDHADRSRTVSRLAGRVAAALGHDDETVLRAELAGRLRDVGRIALPAGADERAHPDLGAELVGAEPGLADVAEIIRQHHENFDGTGYPRRIAGGRILAEARIVAACDRWVDLCAAQPLSTSETRARLGRLRGTTLDPAVVDALLDTVTR